MRANFSGVRQFFLGLALLLPLFGGTAWAQAQAQAQETQAQRQQVQPGNNAPTWREVRSGKEGYTSVKGRETGVLIQTEGETWRRLRNGPITQYGGWLVVLVLIAMAVFYKVRGPMGLHGPLTGKLIERFSGFERIAHWSMAISFCVLAVSGLTMLFGKHVLLPVIGHTLFSWLAELGKTLHNFVGPIFIFSIVVFVMKFIGDNWPRAYDLTWLAKGGGVIGDEVVPAGRFNAGEKIWFWGGVIGLGTASSVSGLVLDFPNFDQSRSLMMIANIVHVISAVWFIAWSITHIYLGTVGTTGAYEGMRNGYVDETWAREHAQYWYEDVKAGRRELPSGAPGGAAAASAPPQVQH
ncbi:MAG: formate dehydrogenase subunit gamma [Betaproteobacteria bacterium]|nr:MAG: formate dehydrogenase subunit gamma [Betaproteobacteria bacterium]